MNDDSGKPVRILNPHGFADWPIKGDERMARVAAKIALVAGYQHPSLRFITWIVWFIGFIAMVIVLHMAVRRFLPGIPGWTPIAFTFILAAVLRRIRRRIRLAIGARKTAAILLEDGLCASCGYNLCGVPHNTQGVVHCPECGAAWFAARARRSAPFAAGATMGAALPLITGQIERRDISTKDHAGRPTTLAWLRVPNICKSPETEPMKKRRLAIMWQNNRKRWRWTSLPLLVLLYILLVVYFADLVFMANGRPFLDFWVWLGIVLPAMLLCGVVLRHLRRRAGVWRMLGAGFCPSCVSDFPAKAMPVNGITPCAECGASWRIAPNAPAATIVAASAPVTTESP